MPLFRPKIIRLRGKSEPSLDVQAACAAAIPLEVGVVCQGPLYQTPRHCNGGGLWR